MSESEGGIELLLIMWTNVFQSLYYFHLRLLSVEYKRVRSDAQIDYI